eukprot:SAG11_NODE_542_length_8640_cov_5.667603_1_plen_67_part_00
MALLVAPFAESKGEDTSLMSVLKAMAEDVASVWALAIRTGDPQIIEMLGEPKVTPSDFTAHGAFAT